MRSSSQGFSFIELCIIMVIVVIVFAMSIPSYQWAITRSHASILCQQLFSAIQLAHSEAIARHEKIILCKSSDHTTCGGDWTNGFIVRSTDDMIYIFQPSFKTEGRLFWRAFPHNRENLVFLSSGFSDAENGTFWYCRSGESFASWAIVINQSGRARKIVSNKKGQVEIEKGKPLTC